MNPQNLKNSNYNSYLYHSLELFPTKAIFWLLWYVIVAKQCY